MWLLGFIKRDQESRRDYNKQAPASLADLEKKQHAWCGGQWEGGRVQVEGRAASVLQTIITLTHADAPHHTQRHSSLRAVAEERKEAESSDKGEQSGLSCCGTKGCEKQRAEKAKEMRARDEGFLPRFPPTSPCVAALTAPVHCVLNAGALQVDLWKPWLHDIRPSKPSRWYTWRIHLLYVRSQLLLSAAHVLIVSRWCFIDACGQRRREYSGLHKALFERVLIWRRFSDSWTSLCSQNGS